MISTFVLPDWLSLLFLVSIPLPFILIVHWLWRYALPKHKWPLTLGVSGFYLLYLIYLYWASKEGLFSVLSNPPRILLLTTVPYAFVLFGLVWPSKFFQTILEKTPTEVLVRLHIFRLVGVFFILLYWHQALPPLFAWMAGIGDIFTALFSIWIVSALVNKKARAFKWTFYWNTFGLLDILLTALSANVLNYISIETGALGVEVLTVFPFCIIPAFAPPTIIFLHVAIYQKLKKTSA